MLVGVCGHGLVVQCSAILSKGRGSRGSSSGEDDSGSSEHVFLDLVALEERVSLAIGSQLQLPCSSEEVFLHLEALEDISSCLAVPLSGRAS